MSGAVCGSNHQLGVFPVGDVIEAVGFPSFENYLPVLEDATFRKTKEPKISITPKPASIEELQNGSHHAEYVSLSGKLIERTGNNTVPKQ